MVLAPPRGQRLDMSRLFDQLQRDQDEAYRFDMMDQQSGANMLQNAGRILGDSIMGDRLAKQKAAHDKALADREDARQKALMDRLMAGEKGKGERTETEIEGKLKAKDKDLEGTKYKADKSVEAAKARPRPAGRSGSGMDERAALTVYQENMRAARASESTAKKFLTDADNKIAKRARAIMPRAQREDADRQDKEDAVRAYQQHMDKASYHKDQASSVVKYIRPALFEAMNKANEKEEKKPSSDLKSLMSR